MNKDSSEAILSLKNIDVTFQTSEQTIHAVQDVSLDIERGDVFGVIGYSGAGKSTLIRTMNLLQRPTNGTVSFKGESLVDLAPKELRAERKKIGMIFQHFNLMASRTAAGNVAFALRKSGLSKDAIAKKVHDLLTLVGLEERAKSYPSQLSGGQKQRVAIARALANDPEVLLCDEATSSLDPRTTLSILHLLEKLNRELSLTIVLITHEMMAIKEICTRVAVMEKGFVVERGTLLDVFTHPQSSITQDFIDTTSHANETMNMLLNKVGLLKDGTSDSLVCLSYSGTEISPGALSEVNGRFGVTFDILHGNIEFIQDIPVGNLFVTLQNKEEEPMKSALHFLEENGYRVRLLSSANKTMKTYDTEANQA